VSIYATLWTLKFPAEGDGYPGCDWIRVWAQGVPGFIGHSDPEYGYEDGDPYGSFLPPPIEDPDGLRAVVFITDFTRKGTDDHGQKYIEPLFTMTGREYEQITFESLHDRICSALRGDLPRVTMSVHHGSTSTICREDGSQRIIEHPPMEGSD
jgi:hypothetical protein